MNYKKRIFTLSIFFILCIQVLLLINNRQRTSFRYFIWNVADVSIGKLICISFFSGLLMSSLLNKTLNSNIRTYQRIEEDSDKTFSDFDKTDNNIDYSSGDNDSNYDIPPTISVNYRVIKDNGENDFRDKNQTSNKTQYEDDWSNNDLEW